MSQSYVNSQAGAQDLQEQSSTMSSSSGSNSQNNSNNNNNNNNNQSQQQVGQAASAGEQMSQLMCATELTNLLLEFAFSVFVNKPQDIVEYAAGYFHQLRQNRPPPQQQQQKRASSDSQRSNVSQNSFNLTNNSSRAPNDNDQEDQDQDELEAYDRAPGRLVNFGPNSGQQAGGGGGASDIAQDEGAELQARQMNQRYSRRKSVFAEAYDPAADLEEEENKRVVHSKTDEQRQRLAKAIKSIFLFRSVDPSDMAQILDSMFEVRVAPGDVVIKQGDDGDNFYVVERGKFQIYYTQDDGCKQVRGEYEDNGSFGELALMYNQPRAATVVALGEGSLWAMDRKTFRRIVLKSAFNKRKEYEALFEKVSVLQCLNVSRA